MTPHGKDSDVDMIGDNETEVEEPPPRLMITKMVSKIASSALLRDQIFHCCVAIKADKGFVC